MASTYSEKLKDPRWQKKRLEILDRDNWTCFYCRDTKTTLHVHHVHYEGKNPWDTDNDLLRTLCKDCHETIHLLNPLEIFLYESIVLRDQGAGEKTEWFKMLNRVVRDCKQKSP